MKRRGRLGLRPPAYVHGGHAFPHVVLGVIALHRVQTAGPVVAPGDVQQALQHGNAGAATATQHVGDGRPCVALLGQLERSGRGKGIALVVNGNCVYSFSGAVLFKAT